MLWYSRYRNDLDRIQYAYIARQELEPLDAGNSEERIFDTSVQPRHLIDDDCTLEESISRTCWTMDPTDPRSDFWHAWLKKRICDRSHEFQGQPEPRE